MAQTCTSVLEQGVPTLVVFVKRDLGLSAAAAGAIVAVMGVGRLCGFYAAGRAVDRFGERRVLFLGACGAGGFMMIAAGLPLAGFLTVGFVVGLFLATATPAGGKLVYSAFGERRRELAMGIRQAAVPCGGLVAAGTLPLIAHAAGWRTSFVIAGVVPCVGASVGFALAGLGPRVADAARAARRSTRSIITRDFCLWTLWGTILVGSQYVMLTFFAIDVSRRADVSERTAALLLLVFQAGGIVGRVAWGWLSDRRRGTRSRTMPIAMTALAVAACIALAAVPLHGIVGFGLLGAIAGISINSWQGIWMTRLTAMAGVESAGTAAGVALTFMALGWIAFTPGLGAVADAAGYPAMWGALAGLLGVAGLAVLRLRS